MLAKIKAYFFIVEFVVTILITIVLMYIFQNLTHQIRTIWAKIQTFVMDFNIIQKGKPCYDAKLVVANHQSLVDIIALEATYEKNLCWVAKKEIRNIPLFGHILQAPKMIVIDRKDRRSLVKLIKESKKRLSEGRVIAMFPEGTRGKGDKILKFQNGAKFLAEKLNLKVQPVVITNTRHIFDSQNLLAHSGDITLTYLDPINPSENDNWYEDMKKNMEKTLEKELKNYNLTTK